MGTIGRGFFNDEVSHAYTTFKLLLDGNMRTSLLCLVAYLTVGLVAHLAVICLAAFGGFEPPELSLARELLTIV
jgi:hypothetical protein